jgi:hypothetical protein
MVNRQSRECCRDLPVASRIVPGAPRCSLTADAGLLTSAPAPRLQFPRCMLKCAVSESAKLMSVGSFPAWGRGWPRARLLALSAGLFAPAKRARIGWGMSRLCRFTAHFAVNLGGCGGVLPSCSIPIAGGAAKSIRPACPALRRAGPFYCFRQTETACTRPLIGTDAEYWPAMMGCGRSDRDHCRSGTSLAWSRSCASDKSR